MAKLTGFEILPPRPDQQQAVDALFGDDPLGRENLHRLAAFGRPGDMLLGAITVRPGSGGDPTIAHFRIHIIEQLRRQGIGTKLAQHLFQMALANNCRTLILGEFVNDGSSQHAFTQAIGMTPQRSYKRWHVTASASLKWAMPYLQPYRDSHPHLVGTQVVPLAEVDPAAVSQFFTEFYGGYADRYQQDIRNNLTHNQLSAVAIRDGQILAATLVELMTATKDRPDCARLNLIAVRRDLRLGPLAVLLSADMATRMQLYGIEDCVFNADEQHDRYAVSYAKRCKGRSGVTQYRMAIDADRMRQEMQKIKVPPDGLEPSTR